MFQQYYYLYSYGFIWYVFDRLCVFSTEWFCKVGLSMGAPSFNIHQ